MIAFSLTGATRRYGTRQALAPTSLQLARGERVALLGPSGGGKTTLLSLLAGSLRSTSGTVHADTTDLASSTPASLRRHRRRCAIVAQGGALVPQLSVHHNALATRLARSSSWRTLSASLLPASLARNARDRRDVATQLANVGLADRQDSPTADLSGGERQRLAVVRALLDPCDALLCDEPTTGLDPATADTVLALLADHAATHSATLVIATHWASLTLPYVDRVIGLAGGTVALDLPRAQVTPTLLAQLYSDSSELR